MPKWLWCLVCSLMLSACGNVNFNEMLLVSDAQKHAIDQLLVEARYYYDKGDTNKALELTNEAMKINPYGEDTLILKTYIYLSRAGLDGFQISKSLIGQSDKKESATTSTANDKTTESFSALAKVMKLTPTDLATMGESKIVEGTTIQLYYPYDVDTARAGGSATMDNIATAIATICPLISDEAKDADNPRHVCADSPQQVQKSAKSHFAWSLAHLGEAIAFYTIVLYDDGNLVPNIQDVALGIDRSNITQLVSRVAILKDAIQSIFPTGDAAPKSLLNALFSDLYTTNKGFAAIEGMPPSVTKAISDAIESIQKKLSKLGGSSEDPSTQNEALRNSLTTGLSGDLKTKIEAASSISEEQKVSICCAYRAINTQAADPSNCALVADSQCTPAP